MSPVFPIPAIKHGDFKTVGSCFSYCAIWNFYDYPTCVIPRVHIVDESDTNPNEYIDTGLRMSDADPNGKESLIITLFSPNYSNAGIR